MQTTKAETATSFDVLKNAVIADYSNGNTNSSNYVDLATSIAYSVLKKVIDPQRNTATKAESVSNSGMNNALVQLRRDIARDSKKTADYHISFGDGLDLVNTAYLAIVSELDKQKKRNESASFDAVYMVKRITRKVVLYGEEPAFVEVETTPIQEIYRTVRRYIQNSKAVATDPKNGYSYIEDFISDDDGDSEKSAIYYRLPKYADLGGNDTNDLYSADRETADRTAEIIASLELTDRQAEILKYRQQGLSFDSIAERLHVSKHAVYKTAQQVQKKAVKVGLKK